MLPERGRAAAIIQKTKSFAESMVRRDTFEWRERLSKHVQAGRLSEEQANEIIEAERDEAINRYMTEREAGKHNDHHSLTAGLTAYVTDEAKYYIERALDIAINPMGFSPPIFVKLPELSNNNDRSIYAMELESGGYEYVPDGSLGRMDFYPEPRTAENGNITMLSGPRLSVYPHSVVRIEGSGGELWQNPDFSGLVIKQE